jgi:MoxR-like ATPase
MSESPSPSPDTAASAPGSGPGSAPGSGASTELVGGVRQAYAQLDEQIGKIIVGQDEVIEQVVMALFCRGHALLVGVPGLAKTLLISTIARTLSLSFNRIQFTPDLMPSDITGTEMIEEDRTTGRRELRFVKGPVFANVILADEINRTPPKTQAALLESMQEHHVTIGGVQHSLPQPFFVLATQNPIEQEGTYPLPEAQLDRFLFMINVGYPSENEELDIVKRTTARREVQLEHVVDAEKVMQIQNLVRDVPAADHVIRYALRLVRATRRPARGADDHRPEYIRQYLSWGAGPRASQALILAGKARAVLHGRTHVTPEDVQQVAPPVLRHRLITNFNAEADGVRSDDLIDQLLGDIKPDSAAGKGEREMDAVLH